MKKKLLLLIFLLSLCLPVNIYANTEDTYQTGTLQADIRNLTSPVTTIGSDSVSISRAGSGSSSISISKTGSVSSKQVNALYQALKSYKKTVNLKKYKIHKNNMQTVLDKAFTKDYYVQDAISSVNISYLYDNQGYISTVRIYYLYNVKTMKNRYNSLQKAVTTAKETIGTGLTDEEAAVAIHDYIIKTASFNTAYANQLEHSNPDTFVPNYNNHSAYGILCKKSGVCSGYAYAYRILLKEYGIESIFIESAAMNHGWNMIKLGNRWYHVDTTWDDPDANVYWTANGSGDLVYYNYFLLNNTEMRNADHYSWTPSKTSNSTVYSNMPRYSSNEQLFYKGNWYLITYENSIYNYVRYTMQGNASTVVSSVSPFYLLKDRVFYQPDTYSLSSMNKNGDMVRSHNEAITTTGLIPTGTAYSILSVDSNTNAIQLQYTETTLDSNNNTITTPLTKTLTLSNYELRTTDYATSLTLNRSTISIGKNKTATLKATLGSDWPILNTKVVFRVNSAGKKIIKATKVSAFQYRFKGIKKGTATITVTVPNTSLRKTCKVTVK